MRKLVFGVLLLVALAGGAYVLSRFWAWLFPPFPEKLFPANTLVYSYIPDLDLAKRALRQTLLWKSLDKSSSLNPDRQMDRALVMIENTTGIDVRPLVGQMTGDTAAGLFPVSDGRRGGAFEAYVSDTTKTAELIEQSIDPALRRRMPDLKKTEGHHGNVTYYTYSSLRFPAKFGPCYFFSNHHLVLATTEASALVVLSVLDGKTASLGKDSLFQDAKSGLGNRAGALAYLNLHQTLGLVKESLPATAQRLWPPLLRITGLESVQSISYSAIVKDDGFSETGFVSIGQNPGGLLKIYLDQQSQKLSFPGTAPSSSKMVSAGTLPDFAKMWDEVNAQMKTVLTPDEFQKWQQGLDFLKGVLNFDVRRDLLDTLGSEFGTAFEPSTQVGADPADARWLLALQLKKPDQFKETIDRLVSLASTLQTFKRSEEEYKGKKIVTLVGSVAGKELSPSFVFNGSWFYFATQQDLLKKTMDTDRSESAAANKDFKKVTSGFPSRVNGLSYTDVHEYLKAYARMMEGQVDSGQAPLFEGSKIPQDLAQLSDRLYGAGSFLQIQRKGVYYRSYSSVPSSFLALPALIASYPKFLEEYHSHQN